jgi:undecaprenyl-diphosphatase
MTLIQSLILSIVEGITEFLPVSSTGHMIIASSLMGIAEDDFTKAFTVAIQFGAILSVVGLYWRKFIQSFSFYITLLVAFIPAAILGKLFSKQIDMLLENVVVVAFSLLLGGIFLLFVDRLFNGKEIKDKEVSLPSAFKIGLFQTLAMIPGVSRSAASIIGGLSQGLNRKKAAEFSFFLAVPTMFAATVYKLYEFYFKDGHRFEDGQVQLLIVGNLVAFVVAMLAIRSFIGYLSKYGFKVFGYYRIVLGLFILILYYLGIPLSIL